MRPSTRRASAPVNSTVWTLDVDFALFMHGAIVFGEALVLLPDAPSTFAIPHPDIFGPP